MTAPATIVREWAQPTTPGEALPPPPGHHAQRIKFYGTLTNGKERETQLVDVLAGEGAPTPTDGWAKWAKVPRWGRVAMTVLEGYEPIVLEIPVLFDAVLETSPRMDVELEIQRLEWMGGRGIAFNQHHGAKGHVGHPGVGDSPLIQVFAIDSDGDEVHLIPKQFQTNNLRWVLTGLQFDPNPLRDRAGARIRQAATVILTQHIPSPGGSFDSASTRAAFRKQLHGSIVKHTTTSVNTVAKIAIEEILAHHLPPSRKAQMVKEILAANKLGSNPEKPLRHGTVVRVPYAALTPV